MYQTQAPSISSAGTPAKSNHPPQQPYSLTVDYYADSGGVSQLMTPAVWMFYANFTAPREILYRQDTGARVYPKKPLLLRPLHGAGLISPAFPNATMEVKHVKQIALRVDSPYYHVPVTAYTGDLSCASFWTCYSPMAGISKRSSETR
ncbi:hypothetical protein GWK47_032286 [Chionoecetes opilio]|uniref:Uncharacterized protein n=1 Tax=Chionoecetes opilio TaxID=41210 RepID=A0A8J5D1Q7_CHIOP|nr:hypothetical protein GWK47_032286 [Chionoecetes opilio]